VDQRALRALVEQLLQPGGALGPRPGHPVLDRSEAMRDAAPVHLGVLAQVQRREVEAEGLGAPQEAVHGKRPAFWPLFSARLSR
jgi:hypothetical protein